MSKVPQLGEWPHALIHIDMDTFFVSVERKMDPSLEGKPVIVGGRAGGNRERGVVAACSYETRKFGVHSAMPLVQALRLCPQAIVIPVGRSDYGAYSREIRELLEGFTDLVEMASPDEAYIDLQGTELLHGPPLVAADKLRRAVREGSGLPVSVGLATSRTVAKIASKLSKPRGLFVVFPGQEAAILKPLALRTLPGLGKKTEARLRELGIRTLGELVDLGEERMASISGSHGRDLWRRARGLGSAQVTPHRERVQISAESTFVRDIGDREILANKLARMTMRVGSSLRAKGKQARTLTLKLRYPDFTTLTRQVPLVPPSSDDPTLLASAIRLLDATWDRKRPIRLMGVGVSNLEEDVQEDFLLLPERSKKRRLMEAIDAVNEREGDGVVWGSMLYEESDRSKGSERRRES